MRETGAYKRAYTYAGRPGGRPATGARAAVQRAATTPIHFHTVCVCVHLHCPAAGLAPPPQQQPHAGGVCVWSAAPRQANKQAMPFVIVGLNGTEKLKQVDELELDCIALSVALSWSRGRGARTKAPADL